MVAVGDLAFTEVLDAGVPTDEDELLLPDMYELDVPIGVGVLLDMNLC